MGREMGMYTECVLGFKYLSGDHPEFHDVLIKMIDCKHEEINPLPTHPFFSLPRWTMVPVCSSYYFAIHEPMNLVVKKPYIADKAKEVVLVSIRFSLKNYDDEINYFVDYISPYVEGSGGDGDILGYSLYEENDEIITLRKTNPTPEEQK